MEKIDAKAKAYDNNFYANMADKHKERTAVTSAEEIVPYILSLFPETRSVVDVGCATGTWLREFSKQGVEDIKGIDGSWVDKSKLLISSDKFQEYNLGEKYIPDKQYDLVISLEVAEHIEPKSESNFIDSLVSLGNIIVFSAAIPNQGGTLHVNEQYQSYWEKRFKERGYTAFDVFRPQFNKNEKCVMAYAQNMILYIKDEECKKYPEIDKLPRGVMDFIHPNAIVVKSSHTWKYIFYVQKKIIEAICKKVLHKLGIRTKTV